MYIAYICDTERDMEKELGRATTPHPVLIAEAAQPADHSTTTTNQEQIAVIVARPHTHTNWGAGEW
jgi:hypothetical protein